MSESEMVDAIEDMHKERCGDPVNHPSHYTDGPACVYCGKSVECITVVESMPFCLGNAVKYLWRAGKKDKGKHLEDLQKARWYIDREINRLQTQST